MRAKTPPTGKQGCAEGAGGLAHLFQTASPLPLCWAGMGDVPLWTTALRPVSVCREGVTIEVEVSVEVVPCSARQQSLSSALSGQSLSGDSLGATSDRGSSVGVPVE